MPYPVIDFHIHINDPATWGKQQIQLNDRFISTSGFRDVLGPDNLPDPKRLIALMDREEIDYCCIITGRIPTNEYTRDFCRNEPRLIPFANCNPHVMRNLRDLPARWLDEGFAGIKLLPNIHHFYVNDRRLYSLYEKVIEYDVPVLMHIGSSVFPGAKFKYCDPLTIDEVAADFPEAKLIIAHGGRGWWYEQCFFLSKLHRNVYLEISGLPPKRLFEYFPEFTSNTDKIIWGTDWPGVPGFRLNRQGIEALDISDDAKAKILGLTAAKVLNLDITDRS